MHAECELRSVMGHVVRVCPCHGFDSSRMSARLAWDRVMALTSSTRLKAGNGGSGVSSSG